MTLSGTCVGPGINNFGNDSIYVLIILLIIEGKYNIIN
jgi:hypothetical protein